jgi:hypothetical protein
VSPPVKNALDISSADRPAASYASTDAVDMSVDRIVSSLSASPVLSM